MGIVKLGSLAVKGFRPVKTYDVTCDECGKKSTIMTSNELSCFMSDGGWHTRENHNTYCGECMDKILDWHEMENNI